MSLLQIILRSLGDVPREILLKWINMGIMMGLTFPCLILLRPVTNRLLNPGGRVILWMLGWMSWIGFAYRRLGQIKFLPVTFRSLVIPRTQTDIGIGSTEPAFIPTEIEAGVEYTFVLPGGAEIPFTLGQTAVTFLSLAGLFAVMFTLWWVFHGEYRFLTRYRENRWLTQEELADLGVDEGKFFVAVKVCEGLPSSFVTYGRFAGAEKGTNYAIYLQAELPKHRRKLVIQHELQHIYSYHIVLKSYLTLALVLFWWNPVLWVAYRLTCRDMELHCDERVLSGLDGEQRKEYAKTLVELGSGRFLWGTVASFGECDAAIRVKRAVAWKKEPEIVGGMRILLVIVLGLFFYTGALDWTAPAYQVAENPVQEAEDWDGDDAIWREYLQGPKLVDELREMTGLAALIPIHIYEVREGEAYVRDYLSREFLCFFAQDMEGIWYLADYEQLMTEKLDTQGLEYIEPWTRKDR